MNRLLLVGWDAADWKLIDPLLARGEMPNLASLLGRGVRGNIATIHPPLSPMLWTSIATGKRPSRHGIFGFTEPTPDGLAVQPVGNLGRRTKALWNVAHQNGKRSVVVGWWPSHPAEPIRGAMVSDLFPLKWEQRCDSRMVPGTVWPPVLSSQLAELRVHPSEIDAAILNLFVPGWESINQQEDQSLHDLAGIIAETMSVHAAATELLENEPWDLAAVYYSGIDHFCHRFVRYHAAKSVAEKGEAPSLFAEVVENAYRYHDVMLGRLLALAGRDSAVMLISDHGFHSDKLLPEYIPAEAAGPAVEHREFGIFCMVGPGVRVGEEIYGASILDVAPTALHLLGLPAGKDMDGKVLVNAFRDTVEVAKIESWDLVPGEDGSHPAGERYEGAAAAEAINQLVDLGYVAPPGKDARLAVDECLTEQRYNLARAHADEGRADLAVPLLRELIAHDPEQGRFYSVLAACLLQLDDTQGCKRLLDDFDAASTNFARRAIAELERRRKAQPDEELVARREAESRREVYERRQLAEKAGGFRQMRILLRCRLALCPRGGAPQREQARDLLEQLTKSRSQTPGTRLFLARGFAALKEYDRALEQIVRVRRLDPDNWEAMGLQARICFESRHYEDAVNCAVESLALIYFQPWLHHLLGMSLARLGENAKAEAAFRAALAQAPEFVSAHEALGRLISKDRARLGEGSLHAARATQLRREKQRQASLSKTCGAAPGPGVLASNPPPESGGGSVAPCVARSRSVIVVAGLPRSGTSMMMQMLSAAGVQVYTDESRLPDESNPRGYYEHGDATRLHQDTSWLPDARGKAVKIVAHLLPFLPDGGEYRVILMHRDLDCVAASQVAMLERLGRINGLSGEPLGRALTHQMVRVQTWLQRHPETAVLHVNYAETVANPAATAAFLAKFLGSPFDEPAAASAVDHSLHRQNLSKSIT